MTWTDSSGVRIWRSPAQGTLGDDILNSEAHYTNDGLAALAAEGFTGIWVFCTLYAMMDSKVFPELNQPES